MQTQTIETVRMDNGDLVLCCALSSSWGVSGLEFTIKTKYGISVLTESEMKEIYNISENDLYMVQEFLEIKPEIA